MGSSSYLSTLYTVIYLLRVGGRTVTRKNGKNSDNFFNSSLQSLKRLFSETHAVPYVSHISMKSTLHTWNIRSHF